MDLSDARLTSFTVFENILVLASEFCRDPSKRYEFLWIANVNFSGMGRFPCKLKTARNGDFLHDWFLTDARDNDNENEDEDGEEHI